MTVTRCTLVITGADGTIGRSLKTLQDLRNTKDQIPNLECGDLNLAITEERHLALLPGNLSRKIDLHPEAGEMLPRENMRIEKAQV